MDRSSGMMADHWKKTMFWHCKLRVCVSETALRQDRHHEKVC